MRFVAVSWMFVLAVGCGGAADTVTEPPGETRTAPTFPKTAPAFPEPTGKVKELVAELRSDDRETRSKAAIALGKLGSDAVAAVPALVVEATKEDPGTHKTYPSLDAAEAIKRIDTERAVPLFAERLGAVETRFWAATFLNELEDADQAKPAIPQLIEAVRAAEGCETDDERWACNRAASALGRIQPEGLAALVRQMTHDNAAVRECAVHGVPRLDGEGKPAVETLCGLLSDPVTDVRRSAAHTLGQIEDKSALPHIRIALQTETDRDTRLLLISAVESLSRGE